MIEIKAPHEIPDIKTIKIFLGGSIEMGVAEEWQKYIAEQLADEDVLLLNPRRDRWDNSWEQSKDNQDFRGQVEWELDALSKSDYIIMYFDPNTKSPISLLETGLYAQSGKLLVVCPDGFWKKGNIDVVQERYGFLQFSTLDELLKHVRILMHSSHTS